MILTPEMVAADPVLREAAASLASLYLAGRDVSAWLDGSDRQPVERLELIADLIDAHHTLHPDPHDPVNGGVWLIDRPWREGASRA